MTYDHLMTNEEAIEELKKVDTLDMPIRLCEAHYMAIKALEQEPKADTWSIKDVADTFKKHGLIVEQEPKTDVLDKIRAELHATAEMHEDGDYYLHEKWIDEIIDKYRESEG